jgi:SAM-dependent methyltransferase
MTRLQWEEHYRTGPTPWDTRITPPEVVQFWQEHAAPPGGLALDLGCGTGTNVAYLASLGLTAIGFELAGNALMTGQQRFRREFPDLLSRPQLVQADVTCLPVRATRAHYILDIGCLHGLPLAQRRVYAQGVIDNLVQGGYYHLFAFDLQPEAEQRADQPLRGMDENEVETLFAPHLAVVEIQRGRPDRQACRWYLLRRLRGSEIGAAVISEPLNLPDTRK